MKNEELFLSDSSLERIAIDIDIEPFLGAIKNNAQLWKLNTWRQDKAGGQQDTEAIMFRWAKENNFESIRDSTSVIEEPLLHQIPEAMTVFKNVLRKIESTEWGRSFIVKLKPGGRVYPHADVGMYADKFERFHLCLQSDPEFEYCTQHPTGPVQSCNMKAGELWWFNHKRVHWAYNGGSRDRISIVIDAVSQKWKRRRDVLYVGVGYHAQPQVVSK